MRGALLLGLVVLVGCGDGENAFEPIVETTAPATTEVRSVFDLEVGDCFDDPEGSSAEELVVVDCDEPHDNEVVHFFDVEGDEFPGQEQLAEDAGATCVEAFEDYVGSPIDDSELTGGALLQPTEETWEAGDREIVCAAWSADLAKLEGSVEGTGR